MSKKSKPSKKIIEDAAVEINKFAETINSLEPGNAEGDVPSAVRSQKIIKLKKKDFKKFLKAAKKFKKALNDLELTKRLLKKDASLRSFANVSIYAESISTGGALRIQAQESLKKTGVQEDTYGGLLLQIGTKIKKV